MATTSSDERELEEQLEGRKHVFLSFGRLRRALTFVSKVCKKDKYGNERYAVASREVFAYNIIQLSEIEILRVFSYKDLSFLVECND